MQKIPTLFKREFVNGKVKRTLPELSSPDLKWVLDGDGTPTVKLDGACCAVIGGKFYRRYDAKPGRKPPKDAIPCQPEPDIVTGHWPHWILVDPMNPADKWFRAAYETYCNKWGGVPDNRTYEAVGLHFQSNPYKLNYDCLFPHGEIHVPLPGRTYEDIKGYLEKTEIEGIVFWRNGKPECKIKRKDFGFKWPPKR